MQSPYKTNIIKLLILAAVLVRLVLFTIPSLQIDMCLWVAWTARLIEVGPINFYSDDYFSDYFPGFLYILWAIGGTYTFIFPHLPLDTFLFESLIKSTTTLFDLGSSFFIYKIIYRYHKSLSLLSALLYLANPAIIFNTSVWGQIDGIFTFFLLSFAYFFTERKDIIKSNILLALALIIKPQSLAIFPAVLEKVVKNFSLFKPRIKILILPIALIVFSFPFFIGNPFFGLINLGLKSTSVYPYDSLFAFNFWSLDGWWQNDLVSFQKISHRAWGVILYLLAILAIFVPLFKKRLNDNFYFYFSSSLSILAFYLFLTRMHERYLFPFLAFILLAALIKKSKVLIFIYLISSVIHFINLYYVYHYYNYVYLGKRAEDILFVLVDKNYQLFSVFLLLIFAALLFIYYRYLQLLNQK